MFIQFKEAPYYADLLSHLQTQQCTSILNAKSQHTNATKKQQQPNKTGSKKSTASTTNKGGQNSGESPGAAILKEKLETLLQANKSKSKGSKKAAKGSKKKKSQKK